jgi:hypothetical protein
MLLHSNLCLQHTYWATPDWAEGLELEYSLSILTDWESRFGGSFRIGILPFHKYGLGE